MFDIIGEFDVTSGKLRISDPCYDVDTWCAGEVEAANGRWTASVERTELFAFPSALFCERIKSYFNTGGSHERSK